MIDIESKIMSAWNIVDDLKLVTNAILDRGMQSEDVANALIGLHTLYEIRFQELFEEYGESIKKSLSPQND